MLYSDHLIEYVMLFRFKDQMLKYINSKVVYKFKDTHREKAP